MSEPLTTAQLTAEVITLMEQGLLEAEETTRLIQLVSTGQDHLFRTSALRILKMIEREAVDADEAITLLETLVSTQLAPVAPCAATRLHITLTQGQEADEPSEEVLLSLCDAGEVQSLLPRGIRTFLDQQELDISKLLQRANAERLGTLFMTRYGDWTLEITLESEPDGR